MVDWRRIEDPTDRLHGFISGFHATYYVYTGVAGGLFKALIEPRTPEELATDLDLHEPYVRRFCEVGLRWGLMDVELRSGTENTSPRFSLDETFVDALANPDVPQYMGDIFRFHGAHLSNDYRTYPEAFKVGLQRRSEDRGTGFTEVIEGSTRGLQDIFFDHLLPELSAFESRLKRGGQILDIGCGTGRLACRLCTRYQAVETVGVDLDGDAVDRATERANRESVADRTTFRVQDATAIDGQFVAAVFFMSLHEINPEERLILFERLRDVLTEDGVVVVFDEVYPKRYDQFDREPYAAGVETQWAELTWGADVPTQAEQRNLLTAAGCEEQVRRTVAERFVVYEGVK